MLEKCGRVRQFAGWELHKRCGLALVTHDTGSDNKVKLESTRLKNTAAPGSLPCTGFLTLESLLHDSLVSRNGALLLRGSVRLRGEGSFCAHSVGGEQGSWSGVNSAGLRRCTASQGSHGLSLNLPHEPTCRLRQHLGQSVWGCSSSAWLHLPPSEGESAY